MGGTSVMLGAGAVGLGVGAVLAGAPLYAVLIAGAAALAVGTVAVITTSMNRRTIHRVMLEVFKLQMQTGAGVAPIVDIEDVHGVAATVDGIHVVVGVADDAPMADVAVLRTALTSARKGVAS